MNKEKAITIINYYEGSIPFKTKNKSYFWNKEKEYLFRRISRYLEAKYFLKKV